MAGSTLALGLALTGCSQLSDLLGGTTDANRDDSGQVTDEAKIDIFSLKVGDCMAPTPDSGGIGDADVIPCGEPHAEEVFFEFNMPDGDFPGTDVIMAEVEARCVPEFANFVGMAWGESSLDLYPITPTEDTWDSLGDRTVQCVIMDPATELTVGTLAGAAR